MIGTGWDINGNVEISSYSEISQTEDMPKRKRTKENECSLITGLNLKAVPDTDPDSIVSGENSSVNGF